VIGHLGAVTTSASAAIGLSLQVAAWCTVLGAPPAIALGWLLARRDMPGKTLVTALVFAPMVLPPVVTGLLLLELFGTRGVLGPVLGALGIAIPFTLAAAVLAALVVGLPLFTMSARAAFAAVDPGYDELSATLGDRPRSTFVRVTLPLALPGIAGGAVLMFARSLGEFGATIVLAGNTDDTRTIAIAIYSLLDRPDGGPDVRVLAWSSIAVCLVALAGYEWLSRWQRRRLELTP
jgi:molybdate transport system permease protein